jgi:TetR/AcrR family transcriptional repressor of nem operon
MMLVIYQGGRMPRVSKAQTEANHQAIQDAASRLFRARGIGGVSVSELMAEAGLTHGGFYAHFASKDALAASACEAAFSHADAKWQRRVDAAADKAAARRAIAEGYLRTTYRDPAVAACPTATLVTDVAREPVSHPIHEAYLAGVRRQVEVLTALGTSGDAARDREDACVQLATMMGALLLARATRGDVLSDEFLDAARRALTARTATAPPPPATTRRVRRGLPKGDR